MAANRKSLEEKIRELLTNGNDAISLAEQLFSPRGMFAQMAENEAERREVASSPLFKEAQKRLSQLQRKEAEEFASKAAEFDLQNRQPRMLKLERS
jgi:hypothetical protein